MSSANANHRSYLSVSFNQNTKAEEYTSFLGVTKSKVYKVVESYNKRGTCFTENLSWSGMRSETSHLSFEEEKQLMNKIKKLKPKKGKF